MRFLREGDVGIRSKIPAEGTGIGKKAGASLPHWQSDLEIRMEKCKKAEKAVLVLSTSFVS